MSAQAQSKITQHTNTCAIPSEILSLLALTVLCAFAGRKGFEPQWYYEDFHNLEDDLKESENVDDFAKCSLDMAMCCHKAAHLLITQFGPRSSHIACFAVQLECEVCLSLYFYLFYSVCSSTFLISSLSCKMLAVQNHHMKL